MTLAAVAPIVTAGAQTTRPADRIPPNMLAEVKRHVELLHSPDVYTRIKAIWALGRLKAKAAPAVPFLIHMLADDAEYTPGVPHGSPRHIIVHRDVAMALEAIGRPARPALRKAATESQVPVRIRAARILVRMGDKKAIEIIAAATSDKRPAVRFEAAAILAEFRDRRTIEPLVASLDDKDLRLDTLRLLRQLHDPRANRRLLALLAGTTDQWTANVILSAMGGPGPAGLDLTEILAALKSDRTFTRGAAAGALGRIGDPNAIAPLLSALKDKEGYVRSSVVGALGRIGDRRATAALIETMKSDPHDGVRMFSAEALGRIADPAAFDPLLAALKDKDSHVRKVAADSLGLMGDTRAIPELVGLLGDGYDGPRSAATRVLVRIGRPATAALISALSEGDATARMWVPNALGKIGDRRAVGPLVAAAERARREKAWWILKRTTQALTKLTGKNFGKDAAKWRAWWNKTNPATRPAD